MCKFTPPKPGILFKEETNKLYIFKRDHIVVMKGWPDILAWRKAIHKPSWSHIRPTINIPVELSKKIEHLEIPQEDNGQIVIPEFVFSLKKILSYRNLREILKFYETIPKEIIKIVSQYRNRQWCILSLLARCRNMHARYNPAAQIAYNNPALLFALSNSWIFKTFPVSNPMRSVRSLLNKPQKAILEWLDFPASESTRKLLSKVVCRSVDASCLLNLRNAIMSCPQKCKMLSHLPRLNKSVIKIVSDSNLFHYSKPTLLHEIAESRHEDIYPISANLLFEILTAVRNSDFNGYKLGPVRNRKHLHELYYSLESIISTSQHLKLKFPPPPIMENEAIVPIRTPIDLLAESVKQKNCVNRFIPNVALKQDTYFYRVLSPERCTLQIIKCGDIWEIGDIRKIKNKIASERTWELVANWLHLTQRNNTIV